MRPSPSVVMVTPYPPRPDGIGTHAAGLVAGLGDRARVQVLTRKAPGGSGEDAVGVRRVLTAHPGCLPAVLASLRSARPEVIHFQFNLPALGLSWLWAAIGAARERRRTGSRLLFTLHEVRRDLDLLGPLGRLLLASIGRFADGVVVYTDEARALLVERCGVPPGKVTVMAHGAPEAYPPPDPGRVAALLAAHGCIRPPILAFGYLHPDKGIEHLLDALGKLRRLQPGLLEDRALLVAGSVRPRQGLFRAFERRDRAYEKGLRRRIAELGLSDFVRFTGHVPSTDVPVLLAQAAVAVLPYRNATQSGVLNLLLAARTPIVASDLPGLTETLGEAALLAPVGDADALARQIGRVLADEGLRASLVAGMAEVHGRVALPSVAARLARLYGSLAPDGAGCALPTAG